MKKTKKHRFLKSILVLGLILLLTLSAGAVYVITNYELSADLSLLDNTMTDATTRFYYYNEGLEREYSVNMESRVKGRFLSLSANPIKRS